jgi:hypothetical protein
MDFSETFGEVSDRRRGSRKPASPKRRVIAAYPMAYSVRYPAGAWFVYRMPAETVPRGHMATVVVLGQGETAAKAWEDAATGLRERPVPPNVRANPDKEARP